MSVDRNYGSWKSRGGGADGDFAVGGGGFDHGDALTVERAALGGLK